MAAGFAIGVTVVGVAAILALLGILARHVGFWSWAWSRLLATKEEKAKLCRPPEPQQPAAPTGGRPYLLDGEMDWINLWPRSGSYKRFFNLDDGSMGDEIDPRMEALMHDFIPPQPLRPAPGPPARIPGYWADDESLGMGRQIYHPDQRYHPPLERTDSGRSITSRTRAPPYQRYEQNPFQPVGYHSSSTNPFKNDNKIYENYGNNPFSYNYQPQYSFVEKENMHNSSLTNKTYRGEYIDNQSRNDRQFYDRNRFDKYASMSPVHPLPSLNNNRVPEHGYTPPKVPSASELAYDISLKQALLNQHKMEIELHNKLSQQRIIDRYDKIKKGEERIREEERVLQKLRYENDMIRRTQLQNVMQGRSPYHLAIKNYDSEDSELLSEQPTEYESNRSIDFDRRFSGEDFTCDALPTSQEYGSDTYEINTYESNGTRDSPPPPAPDAESVVSQQTNPQHKNEDIIRETSTNVFSSNSLTKHDIPKTPPNTASLTPPNSAFSINLHAHRSSLTDPYSTNILHERLVQVEKLRTNEMSNELSLTKSIGSTSVQEINNPNTYITCKDNIPMDIKSQNSVQMDYKVDILDESDSDSTGRVVGRKGSLRRSDKRKDGSRRKRKKDRHRKSSEFSFADISDLSGNKDLNISPESNTSPVEFQTTMAAQDQETSNTSLGNSQISAFSDVPRNMQENINENEFKNSLHNESKYSCEGLELQANVPNCSLGNSPIHPRRSFLSYEGSSSWPNNLADNEQKNNVSNRPDKESSTNRVRDYIASLSARLQKLPNVDDENIQLLPEGQQQHTTIPATSFPVTPPSSAERTYSQSSVDTTSSAGATWGSAHHWKLSSETPPGSAGLVPGIPNPKISHYDTPPTSAGLYGPTPPNSVTSHLISDNTPPPSAGYSVSALQNPEPLGLFESDNVSETVPSTNQNHSTLRKAQSSESVSSDSSVSLGDLEDATHQITGYLSIQVVYESDTADLEVVVNEARDLVCPDQNSVCDSFVRVFLLPDKSTNMQTRVFRHSSSPTYRERFLFALEEEEFTDRSLVFYLYATDKFANSLMGEARLKLSHVNLTSHAPIELALTDSTVKGQGCGEIMFSLAYLPTAERLTVVIVKAKNLQWAEDKQSADPLVKVYVLENGKRICKKKTSVKKDTKSPLYNEAVIFNIPSSSLQNIQLRITVAEFKGENSPATPVGHVFVGTQATGKALSHWNQMMTSLRKPVGMWHSLRR